MQADARHPISKGHAQHQRQRRQSQGQLNNGFIFNPRISREFRFIQFVHDGQKYPKEIM